MRAGVAATVAAALLLTACGSSGKHDATKSTPSRSGTPAAPAHVISAAAASKALLTIKDVGPPLERHNYRPPSTPLYCQAAGTPTFATQTNATSVVGAYYLADSPHVQVLEDVYLYPSRDAAHAALGTLRDDINCVTGHIYNSDGTSDVIAIGAITDYTARLTTEAAYGWSLRTTSIYGIQFAILSGTAIVMVKYTVGLKDNPRGLPDAFDLAGRADDLMSRA